MRKLRRSEVKQALRTDQRFRDLFPELTDRIKEFLETPGCPCIESILDDVMSKPEILKKYFPNRVIESLQEEIKKMAENNWKVISCNVSELEAVMKKLHKFGRKQIAMARYEDQITVLINELGYVF